MKKLFSVLFAVLLSTQAFAQFEAYKTYIATSLSGLNLKYSGSDNWTFGLEGTAGYFVADSWMVVGRLGYNHASGSDNFNIGAGARYYIEQNGLHIGAMLQFEHSWAGSNNLQICPEVGYTFFLNNHVTIEPAVYYNMSVNDFSNGSQAGLRVGFGYFF